MYALVSKPHHTCSEPKLYQWLPTEKPEDVCKKLTESEIILITLQNPTASSISACGNKHESHKRAVKLKGYYDVAILV